MASINKLMKQAMRAQQQAQETEAALAARTVEATSGGGAVKVVATCKGELKSLKIDPEAVDPCLLYTSPSPRDRTRSRMPSSA